MRKARLGQNFLVDHGAARRIVDALGDLSNSLVIEIGPGQGVLTRIVAERAAHLLAVELDEMLAVKLRAAFAGQSNVEIIHADFLDLHIAGLHGSREQNPPHARSKVVGNIPYYITSDILLHLFEQHEFIESIVVMVQKEVADRIAAQPGSRDYGLLTVTTQLFANVERLFTLPPSAFTPAPKVHSTVLRLRIQPKAGALNVDSEDFLSFCKIAFSQKRKTLFNNLRSRYGVPEAKHALQEGAVPQDIRAEALSLKQLAEVYKRLQEKVID
jgi:16S rRNA (adenine1518-N6/adenine1519-N6)-dimethyltransferase